MIPTSAEKLFGGLWPAVPPGLLVNAVVTDNRAVQPGCVFVAIKGERVDGHDFAAPAYKDGAIVVVAQHPVDGVPIDRTVLVKDPLDAMIALGANYREQFQPLVLAVTVSVGKTTTKEYCAAVFGVFGETLKTEGNQNNEIGMPNTLFRMDGETRYAVVEMGMQKLGEIHKLTMAARPAGALITKIGTSHIEHLGSIENILRAKLEICDGLPQGAPLIMNGDDPLLKSAQLPGHVQGIYAGIEDPTCEVRALEITPEGVGQRFRILDNQYGDFSAFVPAVGRHHVQDALLAYTAATRLGLNAGTAVAALANYRPAGMRQNIIRKGGAIIIEDCYNANPDSMAAALEVLAQLPAQGRKIAVLGDMFELGNTAEQAHRELGRQCARQGVQLLFTVGPLAALAGEEAQLAGVDVTICADNAEAAAKLKKVLHSGDAVLVKASRGMHFEEILDAIK